MTMIIDGTNGVTFPNSTIQASAGTVLQVVSAALTSTFTTSSISYVDVTGLTVSITPKFSTSKILVMYTAQTASDPALAGTFLRLARNSTAIFVGDAAGSRSQDTNSGAPANIYGFYLGCGQYLDSPATTSATTYKVQIRNNGGATSYINRSVGDRDTANFDPRLASSITVMEIAA
jgi:hypothetical protein